MEGLFIEFDASTDVLELMGMLLKESISEIIVFEPYNCVYYFVEFINVLGIPVL